LSGLPVLVVDDNATNRRILEEMLAHWGLLPTVVGSGQQALATLETAHRAGLPFGLILLDAKMPDMDGFTLAERIRQNAQWNGTILLMLSSLGPRDVTARCRALGVAAVLTKPIRQADLYQAIRRALGTAGSTSEPTSDPVAPSEDCRRRLCILLAEDNPVNQKLTVTILEKQGHEVQVAVNGREVLAALANRERQRLLPFDLVLMDVQMPEMDGLRAAAAIREQEAGTGRHLSIIAMTAFAMKGDRERCLAAGMDGYIAKPVRIAELRKIIQMTAPASRPASASPPADPEWELPAGAGIDWDAALAEAGQDRHLLAELAELFLQACPGWMTAIRAALDAKDPGRLQQEAHTLKGGLATFAARPAFAAALRLETLGRSGDLSATSEAWAALVQEVKRVQPALAALANRKVGD